jgi:hypothetical protein
MIDQFRFERVTRTEARTDGKGDLDKRYYKFSNSLNEVGGEDEI